MDAIKIDYPRHLTITDNFYDFIEETKRLFEVKTKQINKELSLLKAENEAWIWKYFECNHQSFQSSNQFLGNSSTSTINPLNRSPCPNNKRQNTDSPKRKRTASAKHSHNKNNGDGQTNLLNKTNNYSNNNYTQKYFAKASYKDRDKEKDGLKKKASFIPSTHIQSKQSKGIEYSICKEDTTLTKVPTVRFQPIRQVIKKGSSIKWSGKQKAWLTWSQSRVFNIRERMIFAGSISNEGFDYLSNNNINTSKNSSNSKENSTSAIITQAIGSIMSDYANLLQSQIDSLNKALNFKPSTIAKACVSFIKDKDIEDLSLITTTQNDEYDDNDKLRYNVIGEQIKFIIEMIKKKDDEDLPMKTTEDVIHTFLSVLLPKYSCASPKEFIYNVVLHNVQKVAVNSERVNALKMIVYQNKEIFNSEMY